MLAMLGDVMDGSVDEGSIGSGEIWNIMKGARILGGLASDEVLLSSMHSSKV